MYYNMSPLVMLLLNLYLFLNMFHNVFQHPPSLSLLKCCRFMNTCCNTGPANPKIPLACTVFTSQCIITTSELQ